MGPTNKAHDLQNGGGMEVKWLMATRKILFEGKARGATKSTVFHENMKTLINIS